LGPVWLVGWANLASYWKLSLWFSALALVVANWPRVSKVAAEVRVVISTPLTATVVLLPKAS
jgi:uncharacterized protein (DUF2062 family)